MPIMPARPLAPSPSPFSQPPQPPSLPATIFPVSHAPQQLPAIRNYLPLLTNMKALLSALLSFQTSHQTHIGYVYATIANLSMSVMQVCAKEISSYLLTSEFLMYRAFALVIINTIVITLSEHSIYIKKQRVWKILCLRMFISAFAVYCQFLPLRHMPLSILNSIRMTAPIFTHFLEAAIMGTKINVRDLLITCFSFTGIILMIKPEFIFGRSTDLNIPVFYACMAVIGTLLISIQSILVRKLKDDITNDVLVEYFYISQIYINSITLLVFEWKTGEMLAWTAGCFGIFGILVVAGYIGQILNTRALFMMPASKTMPFRYINVIIGFLIDVFWFSLSFDWMAILGIVITSLALAYMTMEKPAGKSAKS